MKHCIENSTKDKIRKSLCGKILNGEWAFQSIDHAFFSVKNKDEIEVCQECIEKVLIAFNEIK